MLILSGALLGADQIAAMSAAEQAAHRAKEAATVQGPYLALAAALAVLAIFLPLHVCLRLNTLMQQTRARRNLQVQKPPVFAHRHLVLGAIGIFFVRGW